MSEFLAVVTVSPVAPLTIREALSGIFGFVSIAAWVYLLIPQLIANYLNQSGEAISIAFIVIWLVGDTCSLIGGLWAGLVPVILANALYCLLAHLTLLGQCLYYRSLRNRRANQFSQKLPQDLCPIIEDGVTESEPLLPRGKQNAASATGPSLFAKNIMTVSVIIAIGIVAWGISYETGAWEPSTIVTESKGQGQSMALGAQILGYVSAIAFLSARIPQIVKNAQRKSCEGLSVLFFVLSLLGNITYGLSILCHSTDCHYVLKNVPWLIGSLGTLVEDVTIFAQFLLYRSRALVDPKVTVI